MNVTKINDFHEQAMELAETAVLSKKHGDAQKADGLIRRALDCEKQAAELIAPYLEEEPSRSVLHRSAASLALQCGEFREAERLICIGLLGNPPSEIAEELREVLEMVNLHRHLSISGVISGAKLFGTGSTEAASRKEDQAGMEPISVTGILSAANSSDPTQGRLRITDARNKNYFFNVPPDAMSDIVKPLYEETVTAIGLKGKRDKYIFLQDIRPALHG